MQKITLPILAVVITNLSFPVYADQIDNIIDMAIAQMEGSKDFDKDAKCLGIPKPKMLKGQRKILRYCFDKNGVNDDNTEAFNRCIKQQTIKQLGISDSTFTKCANEPSQDDAPPSINPADISPQDYQKQAQESLDKILEMTKAISKGTEHLVTLPIYQPSEIVTHYTNGMTNSSGKQTLPVATFSSTSDIKQVVNFYKKKLPKFDVKSFDNNNFTFIKNSPKDFDRLSMDFDNMPLFFIPHITISKITINGRENINIAITYQKK